MAEKNQKLELTWICKDAQPRLEPRILLAGEREFHKMMRWLRLAGSGIIT